MVNGSGSTVGLPDLRAGIVLQIDGLGDRFSGRYFVTATTHTIGDSGYTTAVRVPPRGAEELMMQTTQGNGIVIGVVTNLDDPEKLGRVRVQLPHLDDELSDWARLVSPMAGKRPRRRSSARR